MASSIASHVNLGDGSSLEGLEIHARKPTAIDIIGGIFCHICNATFGNKKDYDSHYAQHSNGGADIVYTCVICKKQVSSYPSFRGHCYISHVVKDKFQCKHCSKTFCKLSILNNHIKAVHDFKCTSCDEKFVTKKDLETHKIMIHAKLKKGRDVPPYDCLKCGFVIKSADICESHINDHCEVHYPCPICKEVLPNKVAATKHLTKHFDENIPTDISPDAPLLGQDSSIDILGGILCCHCEMLFRNRAEIDHHFSLEHDDKTIVYSCNICSKPYEKYELFGDHCYYHISREKFQCDQCNKTFPRLSLLVIHTEAFHTDCTGDKPFSCELCTHRFNSRQRMLEHLKLVHEESTKKSHCMKPGCSAMFEKPRDLIQHLKNHTPNLDNWCRQCGLQFASLSSAERHLDVHRRKQYSCPVCSREYRERYLMVKHVPVHFESVMHVCKTCGKAWGARNRLIAHLKTHSDQRSYKCTYCSKSFLKPHELRQHLNVHTGEKPHWCHFCSKKFANAPNWTKHLIRMHDLSKAAIKQLRLEHDSDMLAGEPPSINASPVKAESGIESAGSEVSLDLCNFMESDDSNNGVADPLDTCYSKNVKHLYDNIEIGNVHSIGNPVSGEALSITDTVNAVIDRIDSLDDDLDFLAAKVEMNNYDVKYKNEPNFSTENITSDAMDDANDIKAIVEHIDAMSGEMETSDHLASTADNITGLVEDSGVLQYADMIPVDNVTYNNISDTAPTSLPEVSYYQQSACMPEYGPDFTQGAGLASDSLINLDDHILPHIDPLLTIKAEENAKMYVQNLNNFDFNDATAPVNYETQNTWKPPIITKVFQYEENNDANRMYIY